MTRIAGHTFTDPITSRCACGRSFGDISGASVRNVGQPHWAHTGALTSGELDEIEAEVARQWALLVGVATGSGPGSASDGDHHGHD